MSIMPWSSRYSARWKPSGSFSRIVFSITRWPAKPISARSEEHTSELQSLMRISYAVFCLKKKKEHTTTLQPKETYTTNKTKHDINITILKDLNTHNNSKHTHKMI